MKKPRFASKKLRSVTGWWKHARPFGKRAVNKSERDGMKKEVQRNLPELQKIFRYRAGS